MCNIVELEGEDSSISGNQFNCFVSPCGVKDGLENGCEQSCIGSNVVGIYVQDTNPTSAISSGCSRVVGIHTYISLDLAFSVCSRVVGIHTLISLDSNSAFWMVLVRTSRKMIPPLLDQSSQKNRIQR